MARSDESREPLSDLLDDVVALAMRVTEQSLSDEAIRAKLRDHKKCSSSTAREAGAVPAPACQPH